MSRLTGLLLVVFGLMSLTADQGEPSRPDRLADAFSTGWMLTDSNGDGLADFVAGKVVVSTHPTAAENSAAADVAGRLGFGTTGLTLPVVISSADDRAAGPRIYIGRSAVPAAHAAQADELAGRLRSAEGGVFAAADCLLVLGHDDAGTLAAAEALAARSPYIWKVPGEKLAAIAEVVGHARLTGIIFLKGKAGIERVYLDASTAVTKSALDTALASPRLAGIEELIVTANGKTVSATRDKPLPAAPAASPQNSAAPADAEAAAAPARLDLATLYTMHGLFRGTARMPVPSGLDGQLYVPAGEEGIAMANVAARMGLETTGITLPLATPADSAAARDVRTKSLVTADSPLGKQAAEKMRAETGRPESTLAAGQGELRVVDQAFGRQPAVLLRGDPAGTDAALGLLAGHFPNLWETGKQYLSLEEIRYDLHRFFSLRSSAGQATAALYRIGKWAQEARAAGPVHDVEAKVFVDVADRKLAGIVQAEVQKQLGTSTAKIETGSLHAGTQCCDKLPALHYQEPGDSYRAGTPAFTEDIAIPWEGTRLLDAVNQALPKLHPGEPVHLVARVSEGPEERRKLTEQLTKMIAESGARVAQVEVLCAFKQGVSWLMDEIAPQLHGKPLGSVRIEFSRNRDTTGTRAMYSPARWVHELYPVDEMLAQDLGIPLEKIELSEMDAGGPTYRVHAYNPAGQEILSRDFSVTTVNRPYNGVMREYESVQVETGWVHIESGAATVLDRRIPTDIEEFWDHYHQVTLPRVFHSIMTTSHGELRPEFAPPFDTLRIDIHLSEPDYNLGIDKERISTLEALQEDTFYSTENFINMMGDLEAGRAITYAGRIIPVVHPSDDGHDGRVHIEFYAKPAANPMVELNWTDANGKRHEHRRDLWPLNGALQPRLVGAEVTAGHPGPDSLTWLLPADFKDDTFADWVKLEGEEQVVRSILPVEQARGQLYWLEAMHTAGLYADEIAYPHLRQMSMEFELPRPLSAKIDSPAPREHVSFAVAPPATPRPMIADYAGKLNRSQLVQWDEPISPAESAAVLARLARHPEVNVYWMGRSYLGQDLWAADVMLPTPSQLRSFAKETTLKASIVYSGRQHANEVSSTSHILKLGEQLADDAETRALLKQVNVVLHPITNPDGAELSVQLAELTPNNMLHPGYHGALAADVSTGQTDTDPVYPESRTRRQLLESWLPDAFLNPHGYPSHEWVQPFSEYSGWVTNRQGANNGRTWWIPRGWFTSLTYLRDDTHLYSEKIAYEIRDRIVAAERQVPGLLALENRMNARYQRFGQRWQPENMQQPVVDGIRIYMSLKGAAGGRGGAGGTTAPGSGGVGGISPDVTWDSGYTEAPDETAHGDYMKLMASAGLAFDRVHLAYLAEANLRIHRTEREQAGKVAWRIERLRPNLPKGESEPPRVQ